MKIEFETEAEGGVYCVAQWEELDNRVCISYDDSDTAIILPYMSKEDWNTLKSAVDYLYENMEK